MSTAKGSNLKVVFDTNVYISGLLFGGKVEPLINAALERKFDLYISDEIIAELGSVLRKKFRFNQEQIDEFEDLVRRLATVVHPTTSVSKVKKWPADNRILDCAVTAEADYLVTGDRQHLLPLKKYRKTKIVTPREFIEVVKKRN